MYLEVADFLDIYVLAQHFDIMVRDFGDPGVCLALDSKGGRFRQR